MAASCSIGTRLRLGFALAALIPIALAAFTYHGAWRNDLTVEELAFQRLPSLESLFVVKEEAEFAQASLRTLAIPGLPPELRRRQIDNLDHCRAQMKEAISRYQGLSRTAEEEALWQAFLAAWQAWDGEVDQALEAAKRIEERLQAYDKSDRSRRTPYLEALGALKEAALLAAVSFKTQVQEWKNMMISGNAPEQFRRRLTLFEQEEQAVRRTLEDAATLMADLGLDPEPVRRTLAQHAEAGAKYREGLKQFDAGDPETGKTVDRLVAGADRGPTLAMLQLNEAIDQERLQAEGLYANLRQRLLGPVTETRRAANAALEPLLERIREDAAAAGTEAEALANRLRRAAVAAGLAGLGLAMVLGLWLTLSITGALRRVIAGLSEGAEEVASAAGQVSGASQSLAEGSSEQAASIEETSSSLEEMSSMTRRNADNAKEANRLMGEARAVVSAANEQMGRLTESMGEITRASEETSKIIKTIDEIAFQTNLLALNAAVEAARAGEAGAGFAVVADEVRNLAMRAAEAARSTAVLIEGTVKKVKDGSELVGRAEEAFRQVAGSSSKAADLVAEIAAASDEQAQGIGQINTAVSELDKVTQQNAANAEESASAAEEMSAQAESMKQMVAELVALAGGKAVGKEEAAPGAKAKPKAAAVLARAAGRVKAKVGGLKKGASPAPETVIPLGEKDLADF